MDFNLDPFDCNGKKILIGDNVIFIKITDNLLKDLPNEDQEAIKDQEGKCFSVVSFDKSGYAEIEFEYERSDLGISYHTIWVEPDCLKLKE